MTRKKRKPKPMKVEPYKKERLESIVDAAFLNLTEEDLARVASGPRGNGPRRAAARATIERKMKAAATIADRDVQYREALAKYERAAAEAGAEHSPQVPRPDLAPIRPLSSYSAPAEPAKTCLEKATAHQWDGGVNDVRIYRGGLPGLGKRS